MMTENTVDLQAIELARERIQGLITRTPLKPSQADAYPGGQAVYLKLESMQPTGAFKLRGAANAILALPPDDRDRGIVTCSAGNHGRAVAWVARSLGIPAVIFMSPLAPDNKVKAIQRLGATVTIAGKNFDDASKAAQEYCSEQGMTFVHPFDNPDVIAGQGTVALEIFEALPEVDTIVVPIGGGGLIAGIATVVKALKPEARVVGVSMEHGAAMHSSIQAGKPVLVDERASLADALTGGIGLNNRWSFPLVRDRVDDIVLVSDEEVSAAMVHALLAEKVVLEGSAATALAVVLRNDPALVGETIVAVCTGDNVDTATLMDLVVASR